MKAVLGCFILKLFAPAARSLKDRRSFLRSLKQKLGARGNMAVKELSMDGVYRDFYLLVSVLDNTEQSLKDQQDQLEMMIMNNYELDILESRLEVFPISAGGEL